MIGFIHVILYVIAQDAIATMQAAFPWILGVAAFLTVCILRCKPCKGGA